MRSLVCPDCGAEISLFDDGGEDGAKRLGLPLLASLPWRREVAQAKSIRWNALPEAARKDADRMTREVEMALAETRPVKA